MVSTIGAACALVQIDVTTQQEPEIRRHCAGCRTRRVFASSGKFRVNANGKQVDAWLIYRCVTCDQSWNYPIHARRPVRSLPAVELTALMQNDAELAARHARDVAGLTAAGAVVTPGSAVEIGRKILRPVIEHTEHIILALNIAPACRIRLDRLLARVFDVSRREVEHMQEAEILNAPAQRQKSLRRSAINGQEIIIDARRCPPTWRQVAACELPAFSASHPHGSEEQSEPMLIELLRNPEGDTR